MKSTQLIELFLLCVSIAACGGGSSGSSSGAVTLTVTPPTATVAAGQSEQFTATSSNGSTGAITWEVSGTAGGNSSVGTISASGVYTAPSVPPISQPVTITATESGISGSAAVTVAYSNATLMGQYVFTFSEFQNGVATDSVGIVNALGDGILSGTEDVNGPGGLFTAVPVTGSYSLSADGQGTLILDGGSAGTLTLTLSLVVGAGEGVLTDDSTGRIGAGNLYPVTGSVMTTADLSGNYTVSLGNGLGVGGADNSAGLLDLSGGLVVSGSMDENDLGSYLQSGTVSGIYATSGGNRGTLTLTVGANTHHYVFYAVSPGQLELMCTDNACNNAGELDAQTSQAVPSGSGVLLVSGEGTGQMPDVLVAAAGLTSTSSTGGTASLTMYENENGSYASTIGSTTYTVSTSGRGEMTLPTPFGSRNFVFYVQSPGILNLLESSSGYGNTAGNEYATQSNAAAVAGEYVFLAAGQAPNSSTVSTAQAILQVTSSGQVTGQEQLNAGGVISTLPINGTFTAQKTAGIYTMTLNLGGGQTESYVLVAIAQGDLVAMGSDSDEVRGGAMYIQYMTP